jgi:hypothetical protein
VLAKTHGLLLQILNLSGNEYNHHPTQLRGEALDECIASSINDIDSKMVLITIYIMESIVSYVYDDLDFIQTILDNLNKYQNELLGHFTMGFVQTWLPIFHYECFLKTGKRMHKRLGRISHQRVRQWATIGTSMLLGPCQFLNAMEKL